MNLEIANRLVELRRARGYSQEALAAALGVSRQAVSKWERAESAPDTDNIIALARLYGTSLDELLLGGREGGAEARRVQSEESEEEQIFSTAAAWEEAEEACNRERRRRIKRAMDHFPYPMIITVAYLVLGFTTGWWHPGWMLFMTIPIYYCVAGAL